MLAIPDSIRTFLKSKIMVGNNRPTAKINIAGMPAGTSLQDPAAWTSWQLFTSTAQSRGNMCETADGRAIMIYVDGTDIKLAYAPTVTGALDGTETFDFVNAVTIASGKDLALTSITLVNEKLNVIMIYKNTATSSIVAEFWRDNDGNGTGMDKVSDIYTALNSYDVSADDFDLTPSLIHRLGNGNLVCTLPYFYISMVETRLIKAF
ncbi:MAG: hypothetical protein U9N81_08475 [Bacillota bacterium]|nr:hypothetical protein [Bacillota bacterium]